ncbi:MAG: cation:proton antiporter [Nostocaceae cyanobacterium]|nr:cation:proton antiporter [Nostocaceae cyanobacterium]
MNKEVLAAIAIFVLGFGLISRRLEKSIFTPPMAYVTFGLVINSPALGLVKEVEITKEVIKIIAEITLAIVLFTDASRIQFKLLRREYNLPLRLLTIGLPVTILLGTILAVILFPTQLNIWEAAALATVLAPTDAALGQAVVNNSRVPACIRQAINIESGLNDGICLPILLFFVSLAAESQQNNTASYWLNFASKQIVFGAVIGIVVGYFGSKLITKSVQGKWMTHSFEDLAMLGLSILAYTSAELIGGNGFIATFCAGLSLATIATESVVECLYEFGEAEGQLLTLITFLLYGAVIVLPTLSQASWQVWLYGILSLTIIRVLGVVIATSSLKLQLDSILFLGWFGPRGIASIVYGLLIIEKEGLQNSELIFSTMVVTVLISVFAHGLTAFPGANWYANRVADKQDIHHRMPEMMPVEEIPVRLPWRE